MSQDQYFPFSMTDENDRSTSFQRGYAGIFAKEKREADEALRRDIYL